MGRSPESGFVGPARQVKGKEMTREFLGFWLAFEYQMLWSH